jgi:hypothetical protein
MCVSCESDSSFGCSSCSHEQSMIRVHAHLCSNQQQREATCISTSMF